MARYTIEVETEEAGAEERIATLKALVSSAFRMKVTGAPPSDQSQDVAQAHHVLDILNIPRTTPDSDGLGPSTLNLLGRMRILQSRITPAPVVEVEEEPNTGEVESR
jgi:hypothetical protein